MATSIATADTMSESQDFSGVKRVRSANVGQLTKLYNELEKNLTSYDNIENVKQLYGKLCDRFEQFKSINLQCLDLCTEPDAVNDLEQSYERHQTNFVEFQDRYYQWTSGRNRPIPEDDDGRSDVSRISLVSSKLKLRNAKAKRLLAEHKLKRLSEKHELQRAQRELEIKQQLLEQQCELKEASLEESVWQQAVDEDATELADPREAHVNTVIQDACDNARDRLRAVNEMYIRPETAHTSQTPVKAESPKGNDQGESSRNSMHLGNSDVSVTNMDAAFQLGVWEGLRFVIVALPGLFSYLFFATTLQEGFNLPKPELLTFNGTPTDYCKFIKNFETNIENSISDHRQD